MPRENFLTLNAARFASQLFRLAPHHPFEAPRKAVILKPCCMSQVMLATPMLAALSESYPDTRFDWAISQWARPAIAGNPRLKELIDSGLTGLPGSTWADIGQLVRRLRAEEYDTCFIPSASSLLSLVALLARIRQRVGLTRSGRGFAHTLAVRLPSGARHAATTYLSLPRALGIESDAVMEFYPPDSDRTAATRRLVEQIGWLGEVPLVVIHPGGGANPLRSHSDKQWPVERFALLGNHLARTYGACLLLAGAAEDRPLANAIAGLISAPAMNLAGKLSLGELGAICEVADLYIGNDTGPTHIAAATGCATLAIFGPSDPAISAPYASKGKVISLWRPGNWPFSWADGVKVEEAIAASDSLLSAG